MDSKNKILIVDDDLVNIKITKLALMNKYQIETARSGEEALEKIDEFLPDIILLDISMPGMDGYEVCRRVRKNQRHCFRKIMLVSSREGVEERLKGYEVGADDYVTKPFVDRELEAKVQVYLRLKRAEEVDQLKGDLLNLFAHETRTPLNGVLGVTSVLKGEANLTEEQSRLVDIIEQCGRQLYEFVQKTTFICDLKRGIQTTLQMGNLEEGLMNPIYRTRAEAEKKQLKIQLDCSNHSLGLLVDWKMVDSVFTYLLENAIKYSPVGGEVIVRATAFEDKIEIQFIDQGPGIKPDWTKKIFDEFAIGDVIHHQKGQGLSLAISKYVMQLHGGSIDVESEYGAGATFTLTFPIEKPAA